VIIKHNSGCAFYLPHLNINVFSRSEAQRQFLSEKIASDGEWAIVVDQLNESLHENATSEG